MSKPDGFAPSPARLVGELDERGRFADAALSYNQTFLDDCLRAILPHDLILIGAPTGIGKTDLALSIASSNAVRGHPTHYFALEAEPRELERRMKYSMLARRAYVEKHPDRERLNYTDWYLRRCEHIVGQWNAWADNEILRTLGKLHTFYRGQKFDAHDLGRWIVEIHQQTSLIVVDHLHYVDADEDENENRAITDTVKTIRDISLRIGKPVILVAHLRKKDRNAKKLLADADDFHGSSNITKIATQVIMLERAADIEPSKWFFSPTFISVGKDRRQGQPRVVACTNFDMRTKTYAREYTLGRVHGAKWEAIKIGDQPSWAANHRPLDSGGDPATQGEMPVR